MSQIEELQSRITAALERIAMGLEARRQENVTSGTDETEALRQQVEEERLVNAQLAERVRALREKLDHREAELAEARGETLQQIRRLDSDLQALRKSNQQLRENNQSLRAANQTGVGEPHLINKAMMAELDGLRATHASERDEIETVLAELGRVISSATNESPTRREGL